MTTDEDLSSDAQHYKEMLVKWVKLKYQIEYTDHFEPSDLTKVLSFDDEQIYTDGLHALSQLDPVWTLESVRERIKDDMQDEIEDSELEKEIFLALKNKKLLSEVESLLEQDLSVTNRPESKWKGKKIGVQQKAIQLAFYQAEKAGIYGPPEYTSNPHKYEFMVVLQRLRFGYSEYVEGRNLRFNYNTPVFEFLNTLREHTASCVIPPLALCEEDTLYAEDRELARTPSTTPSLPPVSRRPRRPSEVGYTLNDGPWRYKPASHSKASFKDLANEDDYADFLDEVKLLRGSKVGKRNAMVMIHSMDWEAYEMSVNKTKHFRDEDLRQIEELKKDPEFHPDEIADNNGELWSAWYEREGYKESTPSSSKPRPASRGPSSSRNDRSSSPLLSSRTISFNGLNGSSSSPRSSPIINLDD